MGGWKTRLITALPFEKPTRVKNNTTHSSVKVCASTRRSRPSQAAASISINFSPAPVIITLNRAVHPTLLLLPSPSPQPQPPAPRYRLETCNILGRAVKPDINTFKERRRWAEGTKFLTCAVSRWAAMHRPPRRPPDHLFKTTVPALE